MSKVTAKKLSFHTVVTEAANDKSGTNNSNESTRNLTSEVDTELRELAVGLRALRDEQELLVSREKSHHRTAESTNSRVLWWSLFEVIILVGVCFWQVNYLKRFFEVKRVI